MKTSLHSKNGLFFLNEEPYNILDEINIILNEAWVDISKLINKQSLSEKQYYIVFDNSNQDNKFFFKGNYGMIFSINRRKVQNLVPGEDLRILEDRLKSHYDYFIWLPLKLYNSDEKDDNNKMLLFWILIHELEHLHQFLKYCPEIGDVDNFLNEARKFKILEYQSPLEYYGDMKALKILENAFGKKNIERFCISRNEKRFKDMFYFDRNKKIDIEKRLVEVARKNQKILEELQDNNFKDSKKYFSIKKIYETGKICNNNHVEI